MEMEGREGEMLGSGHSAFCGVRTYTVSLARNCRAPGGVPPEPPRGGRSAEDREVAIYSLHASVVKRANGGSAAAAAAYPVNGPGGQPRPDLVHVESANMPAWASDESWRRYWEAADTWERKNAVLARKLMVALPRELDRAAQVELVRDFLERVSERSGGPLPHTIAIHDSGDGNPHAHILLSDRIQDGIERPAQHWFRRAAARGKDPAKGGARKAQDTRTKTWLQDVREIWARSANRALKRAGVRARIDHRSHAARGITTPPGVHLGPVAAALERRGVQTERGTLALEAELEHERLTGLEREREDTMRELRDLRAAQRAGWRARRGQERENFSPEPGPEL